MPHSRPTTPVVMNYDIISTTGRGKLHSLCYRDSSDTGQIRGENLSSQPEGVVSKDPPGNFYNTTSKSSLFRPHFENTVFPRPAHCHDAGSALSYPLSFSKFMACSAYWVHLGILPCGVTENPFSGNSSASSPTDARLVAVRSLSPSTHSLDS